MTRLLTEEGHEVRENQDGVLPDGDLVWIQDSAVWFPRVRRQLIERPRPTLIWHSEPLPPSQVSGLSRPRLSFREVIKILALDARATDVYTNLRTLRSLHRRELPTLLVTSSRGRQECLAEMGITAHFVPYGYYRDLGCPLNRERSIDVLFLGALEVPRRRRLIRRLEAAGISVVSKGSWSDPSLWGQARTELLNRTRILINLPRTAGEFSGLRILLGAANGAMVVSEPIYRPEPYVDGTHLRTAPIDAIPAVIRHYLNGEDERRAIADSAVAFVTTQLTMRQSIQKILELANRVL